MIPTTGPASQRLAIATVLLLVVLCVAAGLWIGDPGDHEATILLSVRDLLAAPGRPASGEIPSDLGYARLLAAWHRAFGLTDASVVFARGFSTLPVLLLLVVTACWARRTGKEGVGPVLAAAVVSPALLWCAREIAPDGWIALTLVLATTSFQPLPARERFGGWLYSAASLVAMAIAARGLIRGESSFERGVGGRDDSFAALGALLLATPLIGAFWPALRSRYWRFGGTPDQRRSTASAAVLAGVAAAMSQIWPERTSAAAYLIVAAASVVFAVTWQRAERDELPLPCLFRFEAFLKLLLFGVPAAAFAAAVARIGLVHHYMERVQALAVVAIAAAALSAALVRDFRRRLFWAPILLVAAAAKFVVLVGVVPELDHERSPRSAARALASRLPVGAILHADAPLGPAFRFFLAREVKPLAEVVRSPGDRPVFVLLTEADERRLDDRAAVVSGRRLEGLGATPSVLVELSPHVAGATTILRR